MSNRHGDAKTGKATLLPQKSNMVAVKDSRKGPAFWIRAWWPVAVGIGIIAVESTQMLGADHTTGPLRWLVQLFVGPISDQRWDIVHHYTRKSGHFIGYGLLCLMWLRAWRMSVPRFRFRWDAALAILGTGLVASLDEFHQEFLPNRGSSPWDVLLDCCGALAMILIAWLVLRRLRPNTVQP